jgi:hypothetical protein
MTALELFAAVGMPLILFVVAFAAVRWTLWDLKRRNRMHPGE